ncbi:cytidine deaminase [Edaphobacter albus]|uniref:cytidine deaminase n=1 Tax=Edaphobacter sp. 4G125 TaxID=2763071 RepID=UPI001644BAF0|nr:cytidine deaminase [Edaphobacter sp. 4G125]QNI38317.1 cytidine deaminase [Edaphobacter sp. 4G125]
MSQNESHRGISPEQRDQLHHLARQVAENAYAPYSQFRVGAAILLEDGKTVTGCNVENASYRLTTCAEQSAIASAVALYGPSIRIRAIVIANLNHAASQPCGACRQTIHEFSSPQTEVFFPDADDSLTRATPADLLPYAFILKEPSPAPGNRSTP